MRTATPEMVNLLKKAGSSNPQIAEAGTHELAVALTTPLRKAVLAGPILENIFEAVEYPEDHAVEYPLDILSPGSERDYIAYTIPGTGRIPDRKVEADYIMIPTFEVGNSIDCNAKLIRIGNWDVMRRMLEVLRAGFTRKMNDDGWRVLIAAALGRGITAYDSVAAAGLFTKRLVSVMRTTMSRYAGGNSTSLGLGQLTDLFTSLEAYDDMITWDLTQVDDQTRRAIFVNPDGLTTIFGTRIHKLFEFGVGQDFQNYYANVLGGTMPGSKLEICVGLDLQNRDSFIMPVTRQVEVFEDPTYHRQRQVSLYANCEYGVSCLDSRRVLLGAI